MPDNKIPLGKPLDLTDEQLDELSQITDEDIQQAAKLWRKDAPEDFKRLLDAPLVEIVEE